MHWIDEWFELVPDFRSSAKYVKGDQVIFEGNRYKAKRDLAPAPFTEDDWEHVEN